MRKRRGLHTARSIRRLLSLVVLAAMLGTAPPAMAVDACSFDAATATVTASVSRSAPQTSVGNTMSVSGERILFEGSACGEATTMNTDRIEIGGTEKDDAFVVDLRGGPFEPGATPDPDGSPEIEFDVDLGAGADLLRVVATGGPDEIVVGSLGVDLSEDGDADVAMTRMAVLLYGRGGGDVLRGRGGAGTGGEHEAFLGLFGGGGKDRLIGGAGGHTLIGGRGADVLIGRGGPDILVGSAGPDILKGRAGGDLVIGGAGRDRMSGGAGRDRLHGGSGKDSLRGGPGRDEMEGGAGADACRGGRRDDEGSCER